jgi:hypothetical protein
VRELTTFLEGKTKMKAESGVDEITIKGEGELHRLQLRIRPNLIKIVCKGLHSARYT